MTIEELVVKARLDNASDIHLICGLPPKYRKDGQLVDMLPDPLSEDDCIGLARDLAGTGYGEYERTGELDAAQTIMGNRCRIHIFRHVLPI